MTTRGEPEDLGEFNGHAIYPMPMFATIGVGDVAGVAAWYETALGFTSVFRGPEKGGQPAIVHLRRRKYQDLLITPAAPGAAAETGSSLSLSFSAEGEVDALAERARSVEPLGRSAIVGPIDTPWNTRDLHVTDPSGHLLVFTGRHPNPDPEQAARIAAMFSRKD